MRLVLLERFALGETEEEAANMIELQTVRGDDVFDAGLRRPDPKVAVGQPLPHQGGLFAGEQQFAATAKFRIVTVPLLHGDAGRHVAPKGSRFLSKKNGASPSSRAA